MTRIINILACICIALGGCTTPGIEYRTTTIRDTVIVVQPPPVEAQIPVTTVTDTLIQGYKMQGRDTVWNVRYLPYYKSFFVNYKPDSIRIPVRDTLIQYQPQTVVEETPFMSKVGLVTIGGLVGFFGIYLLAWYKTR